VLRLVLVLRSNGVGRGGVVFAGTRYSERSAQEAAKSVRTAAAGQMHALSESRLPGGKGRPGERGDLPQAVLQVPNMRSASLAKDLLHQSGRLQRPRDLLQQTLSQGMLHIGNVLFTWKGIKCDNAKTTTLT